MGARGAWGAIGVQGLRDWDEQCGVGRAYRDLLVLKEVQQRQLVRKFFLVVCRLVGVEGLRHIPPPPKTLMTTPQQLNHHHHHHQHHNDNDNENDSNDNDNDNDNDNGDEDDDHYHHRRHHHCYRYHDPTILYRGGKEYAREKIEMGKTRGEKLCTNP